MIAAAIVCAAVVSQAAVADWTVSSMFDWNDIHLEEPTYAGANGYATYFIVATSAEEDLDAVRSTIAGGGFADWLATRQSQTPSAAMADGEAGNTTPGWFGNKETVNAFAVVFNNSDYAKADYAFVTDIASDTTGAEGQAATIGIDAGASWEASAWTAVGGAPTPTPTPEPTSGLLLLLGVAGLALRRRRA